MSQQIAEHNTATHTTIVRQMTSHEQAQQKIDAAYATAQQQIATDKAAARASAVAKLADLGLTADEIVALVG